MSRNLSLISIIATIFLALASLGGLVWANTVFARANAHPGETEFLVPWLGARTFLQYGNSPYDEPATQRAQLIYYGRLAKDGEDPLRLNVPFCIELFYFPFALVSDYALARGLWMTLLEVALVLTAFLSLSLTGWNMPRMLLPIFLLFALFWFHAWMPLIAGSTVIYAALFISAAILALRAEKDELAGALMLLSAFQPLAGGVFTLFMLWWVVYHRRWRALWGALMAVGLLLVVAFIFLPGWFLPFVRALIAEYRHSTFFTPGTVFIGWWPAIGDKLGWALTAILIILLFLEWRALRMQGSRHFLWTASLTLAVTPLLGIPTHPHLYITLFLPLILFLAVIAERWFRPKRWLAGVLFVLIFAGSWALIFHLSGLASLEPLRAILVLALPCLLLVGLYWMRWWAIRPPRTWLESAEDLIGRRRDRIT